MADAQVGSLGRFGGPLGVSDGSFSKIWWSSVDPLLGFGGSLVEFGGFPRSILGSCWEIAGLDVLMVPDRI